MDKVVDFELAIKRLGIVLAVVLFRDRLPDNFWNTLGWRDWLSLTDSRQQEEHREIYKPIFAAALAQMDRVLADCSEIQAFSYLQEWHQQLGVERFQYKLKVLRRMWSITSAKTGDEFLNWSWSTGNLAPHITQQLDPECPQWNQESIEVYQAALEIQREMNEKILQEATDEVTCYKLFVRQSDQFRTPVGFTDEQIAVAAEKCALLVTNLKPSDLAELYSALSTESKAREFVFERLHKLEAWGAICALTDPHDERHIKALEQLEQSMSFQAWLSGYQIGFGTGGSEQFSNRCVDRMIDLGKPEEVYRNLRSDHPRYPEVRKRFKGDPLPRRSRKKWTRRRSEVETS